MCVFNILCVVHACSICNRICCMCMCLKYVCASKQFHIFPAHTTRTRTALNTFASRICLRIRRARLAPIQTHHDTSPNRVHGTHTHTLTHSSKSKHCILLLSAPRSQGFSMKHHHACDIMRHLLHEVCSVRCSFDTHIVLIVMVPRLPTAPGTRHCALFLSHPPHRFEQSNASVRLGA